MTTLEERLRAEMTRAVATVRPAPDPLGRLLRRRRGRVLRRGGAALGAVVAALLGAQALLAPAGPTPRPTPTPTADDHRSEAELTSWTRRIIEAPVRGNAAAEPGLVEALTAGLSAARSRWNIRPELDRVKVLFVVDIGGRRAFAAAFYNDERVRYASTTGPAGVSVADLAARNYDHTGGVASGGGALTPFSLHGDLSGNTIALAPPGCVAAPSTSTRVRADGTLEQTWAAGGDFLTLAEPAIGRWWRVTCDGVVRELTHFGPLKSRTRGADSPPVERGQADPGIVREALWSWPDLPGLPVNDRRILWGGTPPGERRPVVVALGDLAGGGVQVVAVAGTGDAMLVTGPRGQDPPRSPLPDFPTARLTTAVAPSDAIVAIRLPADPQIGLSDRLLVIAPRGATELRVRGGPGQSAPVPLADGVGVVVAPFPAALGIEAVDAAGATLATLSVAEPRDADTVLGGQALLRRWD